MATMTERGIRGISLETLERMDKELHKDEVSTVVAKMTPDGEFVIAIHQREKTADIWYKRRGTQLIPHGTKKIVSLS